MGWVEPIENMGASYVVFKEGSTIHAKAFFTGGYNFKGKNASAVIQKAINNLPSGRHRLEKIELRGSFHIDTKIVVPSWTWINGGKLTFDTNFADVVIENENRTGNGDTGMMFTNLIIEGEDPVNQQNGAARGMDFYIDAPPFNVDPNPTFGTDSDSNLYRQNLVMYNVVLQKIRGDMMRLEQSSYSDCFIVSLDRVYLGGTWDKGLYIKLIMESLFSNLYFEYMAGDYPLYIEDGLELDFDNLMMNDWSEDQNAAVYLKDCNWVRFTGGQIGGGPGQTNGLYIDGGKGNSWNGGDIGDVGVYADDTYSAIVIENSTYNRVIGAYLGEKPGNPRVNDMKYGVYEFGTSDFNQIVGCVAFGYTTAGYRISGVNTECCSGVNIGTVV